MTLFDRILREAAARPDLKSRNLVKVMRNVTRRAVKSYQNMGPGEVGDDAHKTAQQRVKDVLSKLRRPKKPAGDKVFWKKAARR